MCDGSAATNNQTGEGVAIKKVTNVFSKKILAKRALREIKLLQHFRGHRNVCTAPGTPTARGIPIRCYALLMTVLDHMFVRHGYTETGQLQRDLFI